MESLLSGFVGALIATILSIFYLYLSEQARLRAEVMLEVVGYFDDIYTRLQMLHVDKDSGYTGKKKGLTDQEYRIASRTLKDLLNTSKVGVRLAIIYGEGHFTGTFNFLKSSCLEATEILWSATPQNWDEKNSQIIILFKEKIDPVRKNLERDLINGTRFLPIVKTFFQRWRWWTSCF